MTSVSDSDLVVPSVCVIQQDPEELIGQLG